MAAPTINYVEYTLSLKKDSYKVEAVEFRIWETAKAMLKKLKRYIEVIEKILEHERGVLRVETFNAGQDLVNQYYAKLKQTKVPFNLTDRKGIKIFAANLERGHEVLVQESTDKDRPSVVARIREDANKLSPEPSQPPQPPQQPQPQILDRATKMVGDMGDEIGLEPIRGSSDAEADSLVSLQVKTHEGAPAFYVLFDLADLIHSGGYGKVYRVHKKGDPNTIYAMKLAKGGAAALQDLEREKLIWQDLNHEHILPLLGTTRMSGKGLGLLSPFIEERDLARALRNPKYAYSEGELITLLRQTSDALEYVHGAGVIHGDIKPENILVTSDKKALLCDFGLSKNLHFVDTGPNHVGVGSGNFVATELRAGYSSGIHEQKSKESDIFAFGKTMAQASDYLQ